MAIYVISNSSHAPPAKKNSECTSRVSSPIQRTPNFQTITEFTISSSLPPIYSSSLTPSTSNPLNLWLNNPALGGLVGLAIPPYPTSPLLSFSNVPGLPRPDFGDATGVLKGDLASMSMWSRDPGRDSMAARRVRLKGIGCRSGSGELKLLDVEVPPVNLRAGGGWVGRWARPSIWS